jgi:hypothetical protein
MPGEELPKMTLHKISYFLNIIKIILQLLGPNHECAKFYTGSSVVGIQPLGSQDSVNNSVTSREDFFICEDCEGCEAGCDHELHGVRLRSGSLHQHQLDTGMPV